MLEDYIRQRYIYDNGKINGPNRDNIGTRIHKDKPYIKIQVWIDGQVTNILRSHMVWFLCKGVWPKASLKRFNNDTLDDRIENLYECGYQGFAIEKKGKKYIVRNRSKKIYLGVHESKEAAHFVLMAYLKENE